MLYKIRRILLSDPTWAELTSAVLLLTWALALFLPPPTFPTSPTYQSMAVLPECVWATLALIAGWVGIQGLIARKPVLRLLALHGAVFFWGTVSACMFNANAASTGGLLYLALAVMCFLVATIHRGR